MGFKKDAAGKGLEAVTDLVKNNAPNVLGMLFPFAGLKKKAVEMRMEDIEKSNLPDDTKISLILNMKKEFKRLKNQKAVAQIALDNAEKGTDFSEKSGVDEEWFERFMDAAKFVSSEDMQLIWGKILAGEFEKPGSTPPNMIRILSEMTPELAQAFQKICSMKVSISPIKENGQVEEKHIIIIAPYYFGNDRFEKIGLTFRILYELDILGVIAFSSKNSFRYRICDQYFLLYVENSVEIVKLYDRYHELHTGRVMLTDAGKALLQIIEPVKIDGYHDMIKKYWNNCGIEFEDINDYIIEEDEAGFTVIKKNK